MKADWINMATKLSLAPASFHSGDKKILRGFTTTFDRAEDDLNLEEIGYTKSKITTLIKNYTHTESLDMAEKLWADRQASNRYGSVGFHCYNHLIKAWSLAETNKIKSVHGPCLQSIVLTGVGKQKAHVDVFYRTTEVLKKFPADLILIRDAFLPRFNLDDWDYDITFHFANLTMSGMYMGVLLSHKPKPIQFLERVAKSDPHFHRACARWLISILDVPDPDSFARQHKFNQAHRTSIGIRKNMSRDKVNSIIDYCTSHLERETK